MTVVMVPTRGASEPEWPTLGFQVCAWDEANLVFGPGDLFKQPLKIDDFWRGIIARAYEVYPYDHPRAGRRRFTRVCVSLPKGLAKTEKGAILAIGESHPDAPVRTHHWENVHGAKEPVGAGIQSPYVPMVAFTEEQSDELGYYVMKSILEESPIGGDFDIGLERILCTLNGGRVVSLAGSPNARDGALTSFQLVDEAHRWNSNRLRAAHTTMLANLVKREAADPWSFEPTTAYAVGEDSIAEKTATYARAIHEGKIENPKLFYYHRQAADTHELDSPEDIREAIIEAVGPAAAWSNIEARIEAFQDPTADIAYLDRVLCNRPRAGGGAAFDLSKWEAARQAGYVVKDGAAIATGFDGARYFDSTGYVGCELATGFVWPLGLWERPLHLKRDEEWEVPAGEVDSTIEETHRRYRVIRGYFDPFHWRNEIAGWAGKYGPTHVIEWRTNRYQQMALVCRSLAQSLRAGEVPHDDAGPLFAHLGAAVRQILNFKDDRGEKLFVITKERPDSPRKIDLAVATGLARQARADCITSQEAGGPSIYETHGVLMASSDGVRRLGEDTKEDGDEED